MNKYRNKKITIDGITFHSQKEGWRYLELKALVRANKIYNLMLQPKFELIPKFEKNGKTFKPMYYIADFMYLDKTTGKTVVEDVKGFKTKEYQVKKKLFEWRYTMELTEI